MSGFWRYLYRDNPMHIEALRAVRRLTVVGSTNPHSSRMLVRVLSFGLIALYAWFLYLTLLVRDDLSSEILIFEWSVLTLLVLGSLYGAISGEREKSTWDSLILTRLSPAQILVGKLSWRLGLALGIMVLFTPPILLTHTSAHFIKAYSMGDILGVQLCIASWCAFLAGFTLFVSARTKRSVTSISIVTVFLLATLILIPGVIAVFQIPLGFAITSVSPMVMLANLMMYINPLVMLLEIGKHPETFFVLPGVYLWLAGWCVVGTLKALTRLGLPTGTTR